MFSTFIKDVVALNNSAALHSISGDVSAGRQCLLKALRLIRDETVANTPSFDCNEQGAAYHEFQDNMMAGDSKFSRIPLQYSEPLPEFSKSDFFVFTRMLIIPYISLPASGSNLDASEEEDIRLAVSTVVMFNIAQAYNCRGSLHRVPRRSERAMLFYSMCSRVLSLSSSTASMVATLAQNNEAIMHADDGSFEKTLEVVNRMSVRLKGLIEEIDCLDEIYLNILILRQGPARVARAA